MENIETLFSYTQKSREKAKSTLLLGGLLLLSSFIFLSILLWYGSAPFWLGFILPLIIFALLFTGLAFFVGGLVWWFSQGEWNISITNEEINWQTPLFSENSFILKNDDIKHIVKLKKSGGGESDDIIEYYLVDKNKNIHTLHEQSGINITEFLLVLKKLGKKTVSVYENSYKKAVIPT